MRKNICNYTYNFDPEMYKYILSTNILNKKKDEHKIFKSLVAGYSAKEIGKRYPRICFNNMTVGEFAKIAPKGHYVATMQGHITACVNGFIIDTWNCTDKKIEFVWKVS